MNRVRLLSFVFLVVSLSPGFLRAQVAEGLIAHWKLQGNFEDSSGHGHHGVGHGVDLRVSGSGGGAGKAAKFDGRKSYIEVPSSSGLRFGKGHSTIAVWVHTDDKLDDVLGDIASQYDPAGRRGFNFSLLHANITTNQANERNLVFGMDDGKKGADWRDCGRPGNSVYIQALAVHDGHLYAGTCEPEVGQSGHVYRYDGDKSWTDCGSPDPCNSVAAMAVYRGKLYAGVSKYRLAGSALPESKNPALGGKIYRYEGDGKWVDCGKVGDAEAISNLIVYRGDLYASSTYKPGGVYRYDGERGWTFCGRGPNQRRIAALALFNGGLYGSSYDGGGIFRYRDGQSWDHVGEIPGSTQTYGFAVYRGQLYVSTWPKGEVWRYVKDNEWVNCGRLGQELEVMGLAVFNGKLYGGTLPLAHVFRYDGDTTWASTGALDKTPEVKYRRAWTMATYRGKLFCGTLPSGHVLSYEAGKVVSHDSPLTAGWHHVAAVRDSNKLRLYVDGKAVATSESAIEPGYDATVDRPFLIGLGANDHFKGSLSDFRLYGRALRESEIGELAKMK